MRETKSPTTLLEVLHAAPGNRVALIAPESGLQITYDSLRQQVREMADALAAAGMGRTDRIASSLPNGAPAIITFLAASIAGVSAPLNPGYRTDEVAFYLDDTNAKVLI